MKRRYLVFLVFFMFLYIGPVNLLPYDVPSTIVQRPQEVNPTLEKLDGSVVATEISVVMASGDDDDWWRYNDASGWADYAGGTLLYVNEHAAAEDFALARFVLNIPSGATIDSANLTFYEMADDNAAKDATIRRVDELNPGAPEDDVVFPDINNDTRAVWDFDGVAAEWHTESVTNIVQNQIDEAGWSSGYHICFVMDFNKSYEVAVWFNFQSYENAGTDHAYMNITYSTIEYTDYDVEIAADTDDDWWRWQTATGWDGHFTTYPDIWLANTSNIDYVGQMRFQLNVLKDATIASANLTFYEVQDSWGASYETIIKRLNETNVGPLELDTVPNKPIPSNITTAVYDGWDGVDYEWSDAIDVTALVQEQVNLPYWASGNYIGFEFTWNGTFGTSWYSIEDYQNVTSSNHAYLNITYSGGVSEDPYGENWLTGWSRRQQHNISQTDGTGQNYTVPVYVWNGLGSSWYDAAYVNGYAQPDFDDIRFTMNDGDTELEYQLNATWGSEITDYISNDSEDNPAYPANYPNAVYYNQRTYITRQGPQRDPFITYYDHENKTWGGWYGIGDNSILYEADDGHGAPALFVDDAGYIHVFWGGHAAVVNIRHSKSDSPEDITSWSLVNEIEWAQYGSTYPHIYYDATNDLLHMYTRTSTAGTQRFIEYRNSTDKGVTWSSAWYILDMSDAAPYFTGAGTMDSTNTTLSIGFRKYNFTTGDNEDLFYLRANFTSKTVYNASGHSQGETVTDAELPNIRVYDGTTEDAWGIDVHVDENDDPYLMWTVEKTVGSGAAVAMFTYWNGTGWNPIDNVTECISWVAGHDFIVYSSSNVVAFISESEGASKNMTKFTWDGNTWTRDSVVVENGNRYPCYSTVPMNYDEEIQVTFGEYIPNYVDTKMWAYGSGGLVQYTWPEHALFYVRVQEDLSNIDATIYIYYANSGVSTTENATMEIDTDNDPDHGVWGAEENAAGLFDPVNYQAPTFDNPDDTDNMYARYKEYNFTMYVSDQNGYANIDFLKLGFWDDGRSNNYARWRYDSPENTFVEEYDWDDYFELNLTKSEATKSGDVINCTFVFIVDWSCPDMTDVHIAVTAYDNDALYDVDDHHFLTWDVETRLDFTPMLNDGFGTVDRGDYDTLDGITANGTITYYGSAISPDSGDVDIWISCAEIAGGPWSDTTLDAGAFSVTVDSDDIVGLDTYDFKVVTEGAGSGGSDLSHTTHSDTYIADRLVINMQADDESPDNNVQVDFTLTVIYDYDDTVCTTYQIAINRSSIWWHSFTNANKSLFVDIDSNVIHSYTMSYLTTETTHVLTKFISNTETVTWSAPAITTTTDSAIFYDLFLSLDMWGYLGPLALVIIGYVLATKNKGLGVIAFVVQCLFVAQYLALVSATPDYWWHIFIILFGGITTCVVPLMDK